MLTVLSVTGPMLGVLPAPSEAWFLKLGTLTFSARKVYVVGAILGIAGVSSPSWPLPAGL